MLTNKWDRAVPFVLNADAELQCPHGGRVTVMPGQEQVLAGGAPVLRISDVEGAPIVGCPVPATPATVPCTLVALVAPGSWASTVVAAGEPVLLATLIAVTDGVPPGPVVVVEPGQALVQADPG
jgi:hypothetical protein